jgi:hypothetical protein
MYVNRSSVEFCVCIMLEGVLEIKIHNFRVLSAKTEALEHTDIYT